MRQTNSPNLLSDIGGNTPFADLALTLFFFVLKLHETVQAKEISDLYFFSREGQFLKSMFDYFSSRTPGTFPIKSHYLEISRRSAFLPSLGPLEIERFDVLFRQYHRISLDAFLKSLALEEYRDTFAAAIGAAVTEFSIVRQELAKEAIFQQLCENSTFRALYERERLARSHALALYLGSFAGGAIPETLHIVDVGWKGSIQDNLYNWLVQQHGENARIFGYYIGLVAPGAMSCNNVKEGLLFSNQNGSTARGFQIFNENRSLFEILLPARHGAPRSYQAITDGRAEVVRDAFVEQQSIDTQVLPIAEDIANRFRQIVDTQIDAAMPREQLFSAVCARHHRMVFHPSEAEIAWITSATHVENFGVFGTSHFEKPKPSSLASRLEFTGRLMMNFLTKRPYDMGFWPYLTLRRRAICGMSVLYRSFRNWQLSRD